MALSGSELVLLLRTMFDEEIGKLKLMFERCNPEDYEKYKQIRCRIAMIVELYQKAGEFSSRDIAMFWLINHRDQRELVEIIGKDPFEIGNKEKLDMKQLFFHLNARACAR